MGYVTARATLEGAKNKSKDEALRGIADGLIQLSRAIETDVLKLERVLGAIKTQLR